MAYWVVSKTLRKYWRSRMRISVSGPGHFRACMLTHQVKPVVCSFRDCHPVQSCCWSQAGFCLTYSSFSGTTQTLEKGTKHLAVLLACFLLQPSPSLRSLVSVPKSPSYTNPYTQVTENDSTACHLAFSSSSWVPNLLFPPFLKRTNLCTTWKCFQIRFHPNPQLVLQACLFTGHAEWLGEMITLSMLLIWRLKHPCWCHEGMGA